MPGRTVCLSDAVQANSREHERQTAEESREHRDEALLGQRCVHLLAERTERQSQIGIDVLDRGGHHSSQQFGRPADLPEPRRLKSANGR